MLPTVAREVGRCALTGGDVVAVSVLAQRFDDVLFAGPMVLIDAANQGAGLVATASHAAAAIAAGRAATWAAQVRPGVVAVDVDLNHKGLAREISHDLTQWARSRGLWCATRASGGGRGRLHIVVAAGDCDELLHARVEDWRDQAGLTARQLDIRGSIRPFSAPHRRTGYTHFPTTLDAADLELVGELVSSRRNVRRKDRSTPIRRIRRHLALDEEARPLPSVRTQDRTRSGVEFAQTLALYNHGASESASWSCVSGQPGSKSGERGRRWWQVNIWDKIRPRPVSENTPARTFDMARMILPTIDAHRDQFAELHPRSRNTLETVLMVLLEKIQTAGARLWVPVSERDLHLCTRLDRKTIRQATAHLVRLGIVNRREGVRVGDAHSYEAGPACVTSLTPPPILTPPPSRWLPHCPASAAHHLTSHHFQHPAAVSSTRQRRLQEVTAEALRQRGVLDTPPDPETTASDAIAWRSSLSAITAERDQFHGMCRARRHRHEQERAANDERRRRHWWEALSEEERSERHHAWRGLFATLSIDQRWRRCEELRRRRQLARSDAQERLPAAA